MRARFSCSTAFVITLVKGIQSEVYDGLCVPDTESIYDLIVISQDRHVKRHGLYRLISPDNLFDPVAGSYSTRTASVSKNIPGGAVQRITVFQPVIRNLKLKTILDLLLEHTVTVTDTAAIGTVIQSCKRIQEAGCQTSKTAVSKSRIRSDLNYIKIKTQFLQSFSYLSP